VALARVEKWLSEVKENKQGCNIGNNNALESDHVALLFAKITFVNSLLAMNEFYFTHVLVILKQNICKPKPQALERYAYIAFCTKRLAFQNIYAFGNTICKFWIIKGNFIS
jgi:hypothetical protein